MTHTNRNRPINSDLFSALMDQFQYTYSDSTPNAIDKDELKQRILDAALAVAINRAYNKFNWSQNFECLLEIDSYGNISNCHGPDNGVKEDSKELYFIESELERVSKNALLRLES